MAETLFTRAPTHALRFEVAPRVREIRFGDGYSARLGDGLNTAPVRIAVPWTAVPEAQANDLLNFLNRHQGRRWFWWSNWPDKKWICRDWNWKRTDGSGPNNVRYDIAAEFIEVFDLADSPL